MFQYKQELKENLNPVLDGRPVISSKLFVVVMSDGIYGDREFLS